MKAKYSISTLRITLACLAFVFALVLSPPSASHAASGTHGDHHAAPVSSDHDDTNHVHDADSSVSEHEQHASGSDMDADDQASGLCCSGICISAVLDESGHDFEVQITSRKYLRLHAQTASVELSGFLRPPQFLI